MKILTFLLAFFPSSTPVSKGNIRIVENLSYENATIRWGAGKFEPLSWAHLSVRSSNIFGEHNYELSARGGSGEVWPPNLTPSVAAFAGKKSVRLENTGCTARGSSRWLQVG